MKNGYFSKFLGVVLNETNENGVAGVYARVGKKRPGFRMLTAAAWPTNFVTVACAKKWNSY
jgi:hypothetical protein